MTLKKITNKINTFAKKYQLPILSGFLVGTSYIPFLPWAILFSYLPLFYWIIYKSKSIKESFIAGWVTQFVLTTIGFHWIFYTAKAYGHFPWPLAIIVLIAFSSLAHLYIPLATASVHFLKDFLKLRSTQIIIFLVFSFYLYESYWPGIFPWNLGYTFLYAKMPIYHLADIIGFSGLSFLVFFFQGGFSLIWFNQTDTKTKILFSSLFLLLFISLNVFGSLHGKKWLDTDKEIKILAVQANIGNLEKEMAEKGNYFRNDITNRFIDYTKEALSKNNSAEVIIWPETAIPDFLNSFFLYQQNTKKVHEFSTQINKTLITGGYSKDLKIKDPDLSVFNALFLISPNNWQPSPPYHKSILLAFGEYLPFSDNFPFLLKLLPFIANFGRGNGPDTLIYSTNKHNTIDEPKSQDKILFGPQICYEGLYPDFSVGLSLKGAQILVNVTNDSWFGVPFEPYQHLYMTLARAIEVRRPLVRSTNTGITTSISAYGVVDKKSPWHEVWSETFTVKYQKNPEQTFFVLYGHRFSLFILFAFLFSLGISFYYAKNRKS